MQITGDDIFCGAEPGADALSRWRQQAPRWAARRYSRNLVNHLATVPARGYS
jgi:hypothetical protein